MAKKSQRHRRSNPPRNASKPERDAKRRRYFEKYIYYLEGMADYFQVNHSYGKAKDDHRALGWDIGRQIVALYLVEMLLKVDFERRGVTRNINTQSGASLPQAAQRLPGHRRAAIHADSEQRVRMDLGCLPYRRVLSRLPRQEPDWQDQVSLAAAARGNALRAGEAPSSNLRPLHRIAWVSIR